MRPAPNSSSFWANGTPAVHVLKNVPHCGGYEHGCCLPPRAQDVLLGRMEKSFLYLAINPLGLLRFFNSSVPLIFRILFLFLVVNRFILRQSNGGG